VISQSETHRNFVRRLSHDNHYRHHIYTMVRCIDCSHRWTRPLDTLCTVIST